MKDSQIKTVVELIADEQEAIDGYRAALEHFADVEAAQLFISIIEDEKEHIRLLTELLLKQ